MWALVLVIASPHIVSGVLTRQNLTLSDVYSGRNTVSPYYAYPYYESHSSVPDSSSFYHSPVVHYHQYDGKFPPVVHTEFDRPAPCRRHSCLNMFYTQGDSEF
jgi:hypothetical protein